MIFTYNARQDFVPFCDRVNGNTLIHHLQLDIWHCSILLVSGSILPHTFFSFFYQHWNISFTTPINKLVQNLFSFRRYTLLNTYFLKCWRSTDLTHFSIFWRYWLTVFKIETVIFIISVKLAFDLPSELSSNSFKINIFFFYQNRPAFLRNDWKKLWPIQHVKQWKKTFLV